jgi:hypothetical protein
MPSNADRAALLREIAALVPEIDRYAARYHNQNHGAGRHCECVKRGQRIEELLNRLRAEADAVEAEGVAMVSRYTIGAEATVRELMDFAYQNGFHEHGYDPLAAFLAAYRAALLDAVDADVARLEKVVDDDGVLSALPSFRNSKVGYNSAITDTRAAIRARKETT